MLAIGTIVGDAIIVVEAVQTRFDERYSSGDVIKAVAEVAERALPNLRVSEDEERIALLDYKQALLDAGEEVSNALYAVESSAKSLAIHRKQYAELERTVHTSQALYETDNATYLELLTARQSLLTARQNMLTDRFTYCQSVVNLYKALGGGGE